MAQNTISVTLGALITDVEDIMWRPNERPRKVVMGSNALDNAADATFTLATGDDVYVQVGQTLQYGLEVIRVSAKSSATPPVYTCTRTFEGVNAGTIAAGAVLDVTPAWTRHRIAEALEKGIRRVMQRHLPLLDVIQVSPVENYGWASMPATVAKVLDVHYVTDYTGNWHPMDQWRFNQTMDTSLVATGKALIVPTRIADDVVFYVDVEEFYQWGTGGNSPASEDDTISLLFGTEEIPVLYAAARLVTGREVPRTELDRVAEWNEQAAVREGVSLRMVKTLWEDFYRSLDDATFLQPAPFKPGPKVRRRQKYGG